jgi:hypothetical protein
MQFNLPMTKPQGLNKWAFHKTKGKLSFPQDVLRFKFFDFTKEVSPGRRRYFRAFCFSTFPGSVVMGAIEIL